MSRILAAAALATMLLLGGGIGLLFLWGAGAGRREPSLSTTARRGPPRQSASLRRWQACADGRSSSRMRLPTCSGGKSAPPPPDSGRPASHPAIHEQRLRAGAHARRQQREERQRRIARWTAPTTRRPSRHPARVRYQTTSSGILPAQMMMYCIACRYAQSSSTASSTPV